MRNDVIPWRLGICLQLLVLGLAWGQDRARVADAVSRGASYVASRQDAEGAFRGHWAGEGYQSGETALALLTLLKADMAPDDPRIGRGFAWLLRQPLKRTYEVSVAILALEARYTPDAQASLASSEPLAEQIRKRFKRLSSRPERQWLQAALKFLLTHQGPDGLWRYPFYGDPDLSNAQFALLALAAADRLGVSVPKEPFARLAGYLLKEQEAQGPEVAGFSVPAAEQSLQGLHDRRDATSREGSRGTREGGREAASTRTRFRARGWGYKPGDGTRGSMTAAGLAVLVLAKSQLEETRGYRKLADPLDRSLKDGAAWLANNFRVDGHPGAEPDWLFYYLYTLERAGTLLALERFGDHEWYRLGAEVILASQQGDGSITHNSGGESDGTLAGTCLAVLFLKRSTVPVLERPRTGGGDYPAAEAGPSHRRLPDGRYEVTFQLSASPGQRVVLAGSFNDWSQDASPLEDPQGDGHYRVRLTLSPGKHTYKFVVDGDWRADPDSARSEPDGHGGSNSLLELD